jgi:hypothetical protein
VCSFGLGSSGAGSGPRYTWAVMAASAKILPRHSVEGYLALEERSDVRPTPGTVGALPGAGAVDGAVVPAGGTGESGGGTAGAGVSLRRLPPRPA